MAKHIYIKIEGNLVETDFNYYCQVGASKFDINAIYVNGNTRDVELDAEGSEEDLDNYVDFIKNGPLKPFIETFNVSEGEVVNLSGFKSTRKHVEIKKSFLKRLLKKK